MASGLVGALHTLRWLGHESCSSVLCACWGMDAIHVGDCGGDGTLSLVLQGIYLYLIILRKSLKNTDLLCVVSYCLATE